MRIDEGRTAQGVRLKAVEDYFFPCALNLAPLATDAMRSALCAMRIDL